MLLLYFVVFIGFSVLLILEIIFFKIKKSGNYHFQYHKKVQGINFHFDFSVKNKNSPQCPHCGEWLNEDALEEGACPQCGNHLPQGHQEPDDE
ncbi:MAG TPA: hypothetical protein PL066_03815 [bacterium]|nr:hypothetical protein [bacterium]